MLDNKKFGKNMNLVQMLIIAVAFAVGLGVGSLPAFVCRKRLRYKDHLIETRNGPLGSETILLDNQVLVSKFALNGTHEFMIGQDRAEVRMGYRWHLLGVKVSFRVNDQVCYED
jgi:hypothetical protein